MKIKRILSCGAMCVLLILTICLVAFGKSGDTTYVTSHDKKTKAYCLIVSEYSIFCQDEGVAVTMVTDDSDNFAVKAFSGIFACDKKGNVINIKTSTKDIKSDVTIKADCKSFYSYHQIMDSNGKPIATRAKLTA